MGAGGIEEEVEEAVVLGVDAHAGEVHHLAPRARGLGLGEGGGGGRGGARAAAFFAMARDCTSSG